MLLAPPIRRPANRTLLRAERLEDRVHPGTGTFANGEFHFAVSVRFDASPD